MSLRNCLPNSQSSGNFHAGLSQPLLMLFEVFPPGHDAHFSFPRASLYSFSGQDVHIPGALPNLPSSHPKHIAEPTSEGRI